MIESSINGVVPSEQDDPVGIYLGAICSLMNRPLNPASWLLEHGVKFDVKHEWPQSVPLVRGPLRECYRTAALAAIDRRFVYVEGVALSVVPVDHAWIYDLETATAYDPTWMEGSHYFGVPVATEFLMQVLSRSRCYGIFQHPHSALGKPRSAFLHPHFGGTR